MRRARTPHADESFDADSQTYYERRIGELVPGVDSGAWTAFTLTIGAGRRAEAALTDVARRHGLDSIRFSVLLMLWVAGSPYRCSPSELSVDLTQSPSGLSHTLKRLEHAGLVRRVTDDDGRASPVELTDAGLDVLRPCAAELADVVSQLMPAMGLELDGLASVQRQLIAGFRQDGRRAM